MTAQQEPSTANKVFAILFLVLQALCGAVFSVFGVFIAFVSDSFGGIILGFVVAASGVAPNGSLT